MCIRDSFNATFADAMNSPKHARTIYNYSPAGGMPLGSASLAPPTPLSANVMSNRIDFQNQLSQFPQAPNMSRQQSLGDSMNGNGLLQAGNMPLNNNFSSPPTTPLYGPQYARHNRMGMMSEATPPQSAPATQQSFPSGIFANGGHQGMMGQGQMLQSQGQGYMPMMSNEFPQMPGNMMSSQPLYAGQYLDMMAMQQQRQQLQQQQQYSVMSQMLPGSQPAQLNYPNMQYNNAMMGQQFQASQPQQPFVPSNTGAFMPQQQQVQIPQTKPLPTADFFVHEYSPPRDMKRTATPRKATDQGPKNYTFANHGPEHFEKRKSKDLTNSPDSSTGASSNGS